MDDTVIRRVQIGILGQTVQIIVTASKIHAIDFLVNVQPKAAKEDGMVSHVIKNARMDILDLTVKDFVQIV